MNISNYNKAEVLAALYNKANPVGLGKTLYDPTPMTIKEAEVLLEKEKYFDYVKGRYMKINLAGDTLRTHRYNMVNGPNAAENAIRKLTKKADE